jgi:argininosuccinate synthase
MNNIHAFINKMNEKVSWEVTLKLYKWNAVVVAVKSNMSLFDENLATFNKNASFNQNSSAWFIEIYNLPQKTAYNIWK